MHISNALTVYAIGRAENRIPVHTTPHQFVYDSIPEKFRPNLGADLIDEIFAAIQTVHK